MRHLDVRWPTALRSKCIPVSQSLPECAIEDDQYHRLSCGFEQASVRIGRQWPVTMRVLQSSIRFGLGFDSHGLHLGLFHITRLGSDRFNDDYQSWPFMPIESDRRRVRKGLLHIRRGDAVERYHKLTLMHYYPRSRILIPILDKGYRTCEKLWESRISICLSVAGVASRSI